MSVDISVSITEDVVDIIATPTVNIVNVTNSASIDPGLYDLSEFTNTSLNPFVRTSGLSSYVPSTRSILTTSPLVGGGDLSANRTISIPQATSSVNGFLSSTDWTTFNNKQNALGFTPVPETRTLTINGLAQDLSTDRSWTISTGLSVGTTPIASGTIGRVLFEGTGNVLQQSSSLFWDDAALRFQVGSSSTSPFGSPLIFMGKDQNAETNFQISNSTNGTAAVVGFRVFGANNRSTFLGEFSQGHTGVSEYASHYVIEPNAGGAKHGLVISLPETTGGSDLLVYTGGRTSSNKRLTLFQGTGNLLLQSGGTHTDAGFRLDVNGTARVSGQSTFTGNILLNVGGAQSIIHNSSFASTSFSVLEQLNGQTLGGMIINGGSGESRFGSFRVGG
jgi:hypothetical protein